MLTKYIETHELAPLGWRSIKYKSDVVIFIEIEQ